MSIGFFAYAQTAITSITTSPTAASATTTLVTSPSDAEQNLLHANSSYNIKYGLGNNVAVSSYTIGATSYSNFLQPDTLIIRRTDGGKFINIWYTLTDIDSVATPPELDLDAEKVSEADALYQTGNINAGYDNVLVNTDDQASGSIQAQIERVDVIWYSGIVSCNPDNAVFPVIERGGNDEIKIAAITGLDANGDPSSYTSLVSITDDDWPGSGVSNDNYAVLRRQVVGQDPIPLVNVGTFNSGLTRAAVTAGAKVAQIVQGVAVSFTDLGIASNTVVYGYSIFASDVNTGSHTLTDISTFPTNTTAANSGLDLVAGVSAAVSSDDCLVDAKGPGGYKSALSTWLKANEGVTTATDNSEITVWEDAAIANNDGSDYTGNGSTGGPKYQITPNADPDNQDNPINFNPTADFSSGTLGIEIADAAEINTDGSSEGTDTFSSKGINIAFRTGSAVTNKQTIFSQGDDSRGINIYVQSGTLHVTAFNTASDGSGAPWNAATVSTVSESVSANTEYIVTLELNGNSGSTGTVTSYLNGKSMGSFGSVGLLYNHDSNAYIGYDDGNSQFADNMQSTGSFEGAVSELIYCNEPGSSFPIAQRNRIESYLALKYGITLDQSTATDYVNSAGITIFDATNLASVGGYQEYNNDITGIGRDDDSEFAQQKSRSENTNSIVTMDKGATIGIDDTWLIWGNDGGATTEVSTLLPDTVETRLARVWRVSEVNEMGEVSISFDVSGLTLSASGADSYSLLIGNSSSGGDFSNATIISGASLNSDVVTFTGVSLAHGEYFTLGTSFITCAPGGVSAASTAGWLWYKANEEAYSNVAATTLATDGDVVKQWNDQVHNGVNNAKTSIGTGASPSEATYETNEVNFNPTIRFYESDEMNFKWAALQSTTNPLTGDGTMISVYGSTQSRGNSSSDFFDVPALVSGDEGFDFDQAYPAMGMAGGQLYGKISDKDNLAANENTVNGTTSNDGEFRIGTTTRATAAIELYRNSSNVGSATSSSTAMASSTLGIGNGTGDTDGDLYLLSQFAGDMPEVIVYNKALTSDELSRVDTYLSIKYGMTRNGVDDGGTPLVDERDYRSAQGTAIWDYSTRTSTYYHDVAGIGRDDRSCLQQRQSKSRVDDSDAAISDDVLTVGLGTISTDNLSNPNNFTEDESFLIWGNNDLATTKAGATALDVPGNVTERMSRIWNVQETGTVGATTLQFDLTGLGYSNVLSDFQLITSATSTMASGDLTPASSLSNNILTFNNIDLTNGQFFTIGTARSICGPGNVTGNLNIWLEADGGTSTTTDNVTLSTWTDQSGNSNDGTSDGNPPLYKSNSTDMINSNPSIDFDGTDDRLSVDLSGIKSTGGSGDYTIFAVGERQDADWNFILGSENNVVDETFGFGYRTSNTVAALVHGTSSVHNLTGLDEFDTPAVSPYILYGAYDGSNRMIEEFRNGNFGQSSSAHTTDLGGSQAGFIGDFVNLGNYNGLISEIIVYEDNISDIEKLRVYSYLALKYGFTLTNDNDNDAITNELISGSVNEGDYVASDGTTILWDYADQGATYYNDIAGIGRDDNSCWSQKQSRSENIDDIVEIGLGSIASGNAANANTFDTNLDFLVWGNDNGATDQDNANTADVPGAVSERITRVWHVEETGTVGDVEVAFDLTGLTGAGDYSTTASDYVLIISSSSTMADGLTYAGGTFDGSVLSFPNVDFADGDYFTLGTALSSCGPGGVNTNIAFWYKADVGTSTTTDGADLATWTDQSNNSNEGVETDQGGFTPVNPAYETSEMNFNPVIRFTDSNSNNNAYIASDTNAVSGDMTLISVFQTGTAQGTQDDFVNTPALIGADSTAGLDYGLGIENGQLILNVSDGVTFDIETTDTFTDSNPHIAIATRNVSTGDAEIFVDAKSRGTATGKTATLNTPSKFGIGNHGVADTDAQFAGDIAETLVYSSALSDIEIAKVSSYLAIKYGVTLSNDQDADASANETILGLVKEGDYVAADGDVIWDYDGQGDTYFNDIFGVGRDDLSCLNQTKSKSENSDAIVTFENSDGFTFDDSFILSGNDNAAIESDNGNTEYNEAQVQSRLNREWRVQETGTVGSILVTYDLSGIEGPSGLATSNLNLTRLMLDADGDFRSGATLVAPASIDAVNKTVTFSVDFTNGQYYTLGSTEDFALPIILLSFNASKLDDQIEVTWSTAQEINNSFYTIERSRDGVTYEAIGFVEGAGQSNEILDYVYYDEEPLDGVSFYRLKQTDFNGEFDYSPVRRVLLNLEDSAIHSIIPNPVQQGESFKVLYPVTTEQKIRVAIFNANGINTADKTLTVKPDKGEFEVTTSNLSRGLYFLKILNSRKDQITLKFIVK